MSRRISSRWESQFGRFLLAYGVHRLATELEIGDGAVYQWVRGFTSPRPAYAAAVRDIAQESGFELTLDEIYGHRSELLAADPGCAIKVPREEFLSRVREVRRLRSEGG